MLRCLILALNLFLVINNQAFSDTRQLLDKIVGVFDDEVFTHSQIQRILENYDSRKNISPQLYPPQGNNPQKVTEVLVQIYLIRDELKKVGYIITDEQVESQIKSTEQSLGLDRNALLAFLKDNNITFNEYFEIIRASIEYNVFKGQVIFPRISITEQQIKNEFFKQNISNNTLSINYSLYDYTFPKESVTSEILTKLPQLLEEYRSKKVRSAELIKMDENEIGNITEDGLNPQLQSILKKTDEGSFSSPILIDNLYHFFYVHKKDVVESNLFQKAKKVIRLQLLENEGQKVMENFIKGQGQNHFIQISVNK